jgi:hypothetical protein
LCAGTESASHGVARTHATNASVILSAENGQGANAQRRESGMRDTTAVPAYPRLAPHHRHPELVEGSPGEAGLADGRNACGTGVMRHALSRRFA